MVAVKKSVEFGIEEAYFAVLDPTGQQYEIPIKMPGARAFTMEVEVEDSKNFADNQVHVVIPGNEVITGEYTAYQLAQEFLELAHGKAVQANGMMTNTGERKNFAFTFMGNKRYEDGVSEKVIYTFYNCLAAPPSIEKTTVEGAAEAEELVTTLTISPSSLALDGAGVPTAYSITPQNATTQGFFDNHGTEIFLPTDSVPVVQGAAVKGKVAWDN